MNVFVTGATGAVGSHVVKGLLRAGHGVRGLVRSLDKARSKTPGIEYAPGNVLEPASLYYAVQGCEAVIHLVGIIAEVRGATFERIHHEGARNVVEVAQEAGVRRFIHISALGTRLGAASAYHRSKWMGEEAVRAGAIPWVILRPSIIYGPGDGFTTRMLTIMRRAPFIPIIGSGQYPVQPIFVEDVADCCVQALTNDAVLGREFALAGPRAMPIEEMLDILARAAGVRKRKIHLPMWFMYGNARLMEAFLSRPPLTRDQLIMMREGSTADLQPMRETFRVKHWELEDALKTFL